MTQKETFYNIEHNTALGHGFCYRCHLAFYEKDPIVYATIESSHVIVAFHQTCWETEVA